MNIYLDLYLTFLRISIASFGGLSMIPLINGEMLSHGWMTTAEVGDIVAIAEMTPGPLAINCASFAGIRVAGTLGAAFGALGVLTPTLTLTLLAAIMLERFKKSKFVANMMYGIRPAALGMIIATIITLSISNFLPGMHFYPQAFLIAVVCGVLLLVPKWKIPVVILISAVLGIIFVR